MEHHHVVGIVESGLDDYWNETQRPAQQAAFEWQLGLARRKGKPLVIHTRDKPGQDSAHRGVMDTLRDCTDVQFSFHCFIGHAGLPASAL